MHHISHFLDRVLDAVDPALEAYIAEAERLLGHTIDGEYHRDGHSIDNAIAFFKAGVAVDDFVTLLTSRIDYKLSHPRAIAVRCVRADPPFVFGDLYLAVPWTDEAGHPAFYFHGVRRPMRDPAAFVPVRVRSRGHFPLLVLAAMGVVTARIEPRGIAA